jgi:hypothetical protein
MDMFSIALLLGRFGQLVYEFCSFHLLVAWLACFALLGGSSPFAGLKNRQTTLTASDGYKSPVYGTQDHFACGASQFLHGRKQAGIQDSYC